MGSIYEISVVFSSKTIFLWKHSRFATDLYHRLERNWMLQAWKKPAENLLLNRKLQNIYVYIYCWSIPEVIIPDLFTEGKNRRNLSWHRP